MDHSFQPKDFVQNRALDFVPGSDGLKLFLQPTPASDQQQQNTGGELYCPM
jgi:hypothetical protein